MCQVPSSLFCLPTSVHPLLRQIALLRQISKYLNANLNTFCLLRLTLSVRWKEAFKEQVRAGKMAVMRIRNLRSQMLALPSVSTHLTVELDDLGCLFQPK